MVTKESHAIGESAGWVKQPVRHSEEEDPRPSVSSAYEVATGLWGNHPPSRSHHRAIPRPL